MTERELLMRADGMLVEVAGKPNGEIETTVISGRRHLPEWMSTCLGIQSITLDADDQIAYKARHDIKSRPYLTMVSPTDAVWIVDRLKERIAGKVVVEIGAGIGVLAVALAAHAKHVYAIEADPMWSFVFCRWLYSNKPTNLTYILDRAESLVDVVRGDVAVVVTGSDEVRLRELAGKFAPDIVMPWQDWNGGKAVAKTWGPFG